MSHFTSHEKHIILSEYRPRSPTHSFAALAARHDIAGGKKTVQRWYQRWKKNTVSLEHQKGAGRPRILTHNEVTRYVRTPIQRANRSYTPIHYPTLHSGIVEKTGKYPAPRTVRRYGKKETGASKIKGKKRTAEECE